MKFATYLKSRRERLKLTQQDLADKLGVSKSIVSKWEAGRMPSRLTIAAIKRQLGGSK